MSRHAEEKEEEEEAARTVFTPIEEGDEDEAPLEEEVDTEEEEEEHTVKIVLVGDPGTGKTSMATCYTSAAVAPGQDHEDDKTPSVFEIFSKMATINDRPVHIGIWDTSGKENFDRLRPLAYSQADIFLVCCSLVNPESFENAHSKWFKEVRFHAPEAVPIVLVGTMADMRSREDVIPIDREEAEALATELDAELYVECSAVTQEGIAEAFEASIATAFPSSFGNVAEDVAERKASTDVPSDDEDSGGDRESVAAAAAAAVAVPGADAGAGAVEVTGAGAGGKSWRPTPAVPGPGPGPGGVLPENEKNRAAAAGLGTGTATQPAPTPGPGAPISMDMAVHNYVPTAPPQKQRFTPMATFRSPHG